MKEEIIIARFTDPNNPSHAQFIELLRTSLAFMPHEKGGLIRDLKTYSSDQVSNIIKALKKETVRNKELQQKHPEQYAQREARAQQQWTQLLQELGEISKSDQVEELKAKLKESDA